MVSIILTACDPTGKQHRKNINCNHYTKEECDKIHLDYKRWIQTGQNPKLFKIDKKPVIFAPTTAPVALVAPEVKKEMFERKHIKDLEIDKSLGGCSFAVIGSTKSGKSYCMNYIVKAFFKKHITFLMSLTCHGDVYDPFRKDGIIAEKFCPELIEEAFLINKKTANEYDFLFVFDDLALDGKNDKMMTRLLTTGRNIGSSAICTGQKATMLSATGRSNCNYVCLFYQNTDTEIEASIKSWLRSFFPRGMTIPEMVSVYREMTKDHNFFLVDTLESKCYISKI
jgi:hypothetical protein